MGLDQATAMVCTQAMAARMVRGEPYAAVGAGMQFVCPAGVYRLMAVLLTEPKPRIVGPRATIGE